MSEEFAVQFRAGNLQSSVNIKNTNTVTDLKERIMKQIMTINMTNNPTNDPTSIQDDLNSKNMLIITAGKYMTKKEITNDKSLK
jgi:hypothetical protein